MVTDARPDYDRYPLGDMGLIHQHKHHLTSGALTIPANSALQLLLIAGALMWPNNRRQIHQSESW